MKNFFFLLLGFSIVNLGIVTKVQTATYQSPPSFQQSSLTEPESALRFSPFSNLPVEKDMEKVFKAFKKAMFLTAIELMANNPRVVKEYCKNITGGSTLMKTVGALACSPVQNNSLFILEVIINYLANFIYHPIKESFYISKKIKEHEKLGLKNDQETLKEYKSNFHETENLYWYEEDSKLMDEAETEYFSRFPKQEKIHKKIEKSLEKLLNSASSTASVFSSTIANNLNPFSQKSKPSSPKGVNELPFSNEPLSPQLDHETLSELSDTDLRYIQEQMKYLEEKGQNAYITNYFALFIKNLKEQWQLYRIKDDPKKFFQHIRDAFKDVISQKLNKQSGKYIDYLGKQQNEWYEWLSKFSLGFTASSIPVQYVAEFFSLQIQKMVNYIIGSLIDYFYDMLQTKFEEIASYDANIIQPDLIIGENADFFDLYAYAFDNIWKSRP